MSATAMAVADIEPLQRDHAGLLVDAQRIVVTDATTYAVCAKIVLSLTARIRFVEGFFKPIKQSIDASKQTALDQERIVIAPLKSARDRGDSQIKAWDDAQERQRQREQKKAQEDAALSEAIQHEALGDPAAAEAALNGHGLASVEIPKATPKVEGVSFRLLYSAEVTDLLTLVKAVAAGQAPLACVEPNMPALNQQARALKTSMRYPGVRVVVTKSVAHREIA